MNAVAMRIGEVASSAGVNIQTLRYYERRGLLPPPKRRASGYREYGIETVRLVRFIKNAQELGFTLSEVEELIDLRADQSENAASVCAIASAKVQDISDRIRRLAAIQRALETLIDACKSGRNGRANRVCPIIEALDDDRSTVSERIDSTDTNGGCHARV